MPATATRNQGKAMFVKELLLDNPYANAQDVVAAWQAAGMEGTISASLVSKVRSESGLAGNLRGRRRRRTRTVKAALAGSTRTGKRRGRASRQAADEADGMSQLQTRRRKITFDDLEVDFDRLLLKVVSQGDLTPVEDALRRARRLLYEESSSKA
jgi:hypothetical protein